MEGGSRMDERGMEGNRGMNEIGKGTWWTRREGEGKRGVEGGGREAV